MKICPRCGKDKDSDEFYRAKGKPKIYCKLCYMKYTNVKRLYGLSAEDYDRLIQQCAICGSIKHLHVDHDHTTGAVRGILCHKHNLGLGYFDDDPNMLRKAIQYLLGELITHTADSIREKVRIRR